MATPLVDVASNLTSATPVVDEPAPAVPSTSAASEASPSPTRASATTRSAHRAPRQKVVPAKAVERKPPAVLKRQAALAARVEAASQPVTFRIGTFNVLGSQHSVKGGDRSSWPSASWRTPQAAGLIQKHGVDVIGLQEAQADQLSGLQRATGFAAYPGYAFGSKETDNSILYNTAKFEFVEGSSFPITFMHAVRPQTVLKLRDRATGREMYFVNMHTSAGHDQRNTSTRIAGQLKGADVVNQLRASGLPVFVTGDMNDRGEFFCRFLPRTGGVAAVGGDVSGGCHPPGRMAVDWVVGSNDVSFSGYWQDGTPQARRISDHFIVSATATVAPAR